MTIGIATDFLNIELVCSWDGEGLDIIQIAFFPVEELNKEKENKKYWLFVFQILGLGFNLIFK